MSESEFYELINYLARGDAFFVSVLTRCICDVRVYDGNKIIK